MRVLIATDGSPSARAGVDFVAGRRWATDAQVRLVAVDDAYGEERAELEAHLDEAATMLRGSGLEVEPVLRSGRAGSILLAESEKWRADLVVAGCRGRGRIESLMLGSVSAELVERSRASVLVVRGSSVERMLVAVDGSAVSREVGPFVCATGAFDRVPALVISVSRDASPWPPSLDLLAAQAATRATAQLARCGVPAEREVLVGEPAATILEKATETHADVVAIGSRGISGLRRLLLGSVARNVTFSAPCSVLVVRRRRPSSTARTAR
jgi:nucleotide-binding universal stress UspA family protein